MGATTPITSLKRSLSSLKGNQLVSSWRSMDDSINPLVSVFNEAMTKKTIETTPVTSIAPALILLISKFPYRKAIKLTALKQIFWTLHAMAIDHRPIDLATPSTDHSRPSNLCSCWSCSVVWNPSVCFRPKKLSKPNGEWDEILPGREASAKEHHKVHRIDATDGQMTASFCSHETWIQACRSVSSVERSRHHTRNCRLHQVRNEPGGRAGTSETNLLFQNNHRFDSLHTSSIQSHQTLMQEKIQLETS